MPSHYVHEDNRKHKYSTRACTYYIQRITEPMDREDRAYKSIMSMVNDLDLSEFQVRQFVKSRKESQYIYSKANRILYLIKRPVKDLAITARNAEPENGAPMTQEFTSIYQLIKRFKVSYSTVFEMRKMQPQGVECEKTINDEFKRKYYLTFYK